MSGIVGIVNLDGRPVDPELLERMTASLDFRGPDAHEVWTDGAVGFGHTLLRTTYEAEHERQPFSFDGQTFIVADCRVDAREELVGKLRAKGRAAAALDRPDVELILHAWHVWGEACVEHLLGDFAFAIWDAPNRRLFCARDHMGVKLFYYAQKGATVVFSNTLDCVRLHPAVSDRLNDLAIADFLLFERNQESATTTFADISQLSPAHFASWLGSQARNQVYWSLPVDEPLYLRKPRDYVDAFRELLDRAVRDRCRLPTLSILMSGGLDSATLAATARRVAGSCDIRAFTTTTDGYVDERAHAQQVADHVGIAIQFRDGIANLVEPAWELSQHHTPEPTPYPTNLGEYQRLYSDTAQHARAVFLGEGPDNALTYEPVQYLKHLLSNRMYRQLLTDTSGFVFAHRKLPNVNTLLRRAASTTRTAPDFALFSRSFRSLAEARWVDRLADRSPIHPIRPAAYHSLSMPHWRALFEASDPAMTRAEIEVRHPYLDLRVLRFQLSVPTIPWCRDKHLMRRASLGDLPKTTRCRRKSPFIQSPWAERALAETPEKVAMDMRMRRFSSGAKRSGHDNATLWIDFRMRSLNYWLRNLNQAPYKRVETEVLVCPRS